MSRPPAPGLIACARLGLAWAALVAPSVAAAQGYAFPTTADDYAAFYPLAYFDHEGNDWSCGGVTYTGHRGSDFGAGGFAGMDEGRAVTATAPGVVIGINDGDLDRCTTGDCPGGAGLGNYVVIQHEDGTSTVYAHLRQWSVAVAVGDTVGCGQVLGEMGSSGSSTGPHLHVEFRAPDGTALDPFEGPCSESAAQWDAQGEYRQLPDRECGAPDACVPIGALSCGGAVAACNDAPGATWASWRYECSEWTSSGPELSWTFSTPASEPVTLHLSSLGEDLDLYVLDSPACDGSGCIAASTNLLTADESLTFEAAADRTYVVVVDGWDGARSDFILSIACEGALPPPPETGDTAETGPGTPGGPDLPDPAALSGGCGCAQGGRAPLAPLLALGLALRTGRRRQ